MDSSAPEACKLMRKCTSYVPSTWVGGFAWSLLIVANLLKPPSLEDLLEQSRLRRILHIPRCLPHTTNYNQTLFLIYSHASFIIYKSVSTNYGKSRLITAPQPSHYDNCWMMRVARAGRNLARLRRNASISSIKLRRHLDPFFSVWAAMLAFLLLSFGGRKFFSYFRS